MYPVRVLVLAATFGTVVTVVLVVLVDEAAADFFAEAFLFVVAAFLVAICIPPYSQHGNSIA